MGNSTRENFLVKHFIVVIIIAFCFSYSSLLSAQSTINSTQFIEQYLLTAKSNIQLAAIPETFSTPWLEELEFRTQVREFDLDHQRYQIRFSPTTKKVRTAQQRIVHLLKEEADLKRAKYWNGFLKNAYEDWIKIRTIYEQLFIHQQTLIVYQDIETVLLKLGQLEGLDVKELLKVQGEITKSTIEIEFLEEKVAKYIGTAALVDSDLLTINSIPIRLKMISGEVPSFLAEDQNETAFVQAELDLERAEQQTILDFFQLQYSGPTTDPWDEQIAISASFNIPFSKKAKLKETELQIEQALLAEEIQLKGIEQQVKLLNIERNILALIAQYERRQQLMETQQERTRDLMTKLALQSRNTPLLELYQQVERSKQSLESLDLESEIYQTYIAFLEETGVLYQMPFRNYLQ